MESAGPYTGGDYLGKRPDCYALESSRDVIIANLAYAEGRKAERERCLAIAENEHADLMECQRAELLQIRSEEEKMESEAPYTHGCYSTGKYLCPACIYAEGRRSMEKEFQELLELADALRGDIDFISTSTMNFDAWKKARGIE